jgi:hypothetical protein
VLLPVTFDVHYRKRIAITEGYVHFIRFVSTDSPPLECW